MPLSRKLSSDCELLNATFAEANEQRTMILHYMDVNDVKNKNTRTSRGYGMSERGKRKTEFGA